MNIYWLLRMARWARHPPSPARVRLVLIVVAITAIIAGIEYFFGWPESLSLEPQKRFMRP